MGACDPEVAASFPTPSSFSLPHLLFPSLEEAEQPCGLAGDTENWGFSEQSGWALLVPSHHPSC